MNPWRSCQKGEDPKSEVVKVWETLGPQKVQLPSTNQVLLLDLPWNKLSFNKVEFWGCPIPGSSSDGIHSVPGSDLLEQARPHQSHLLLLLVHLLGPQQHQLPPIVVPLPLRGHVVALEVTVREDGRSPRSVEGSMVDGGWGNTGPCLRRASHTKHTHGIYCAQLGLVLHLDHALEVLYMVREAGADQLHLWGPGSWPAWCSGRVWAWRWGWGASPCCGSRGASSCSSQRLARWSGFQARGSRDWGYVQGVVTN